MPADVVPRAEPLDFKRLGIIFVVSVGFAALLTAAFGASDAWLRRNQPVPHRLFESDICGALLQGLRPLALGFLAFVAKNATAVADEAIAATAHPRLVPALDLFRGEFAAGAKVRHERFPFLETAYKDNSS